MSTRLRFNTAQQVFDEFPRVTAEIDLRPTEEPPLDFALKLLARAHRFDAIVYTACLLPRREGVWWGCQCVRALSGDKTDDALLTAEAWVRKPEEKQRRAALEIATSGDRGVATTWLAWAAGYSGGSLTAEGSAAVRASPDATAINLKAAVILAIVERPMARRRAGSKPAWRLAYASPTGATPRCSPRSRPRRGPAQPEAREAKQSPRGRQLISSVTSPGYAIVITPPKMHVSTLMLSSAGTLSRITGGETDAGTQGAGVAGVQGTGVGVPNAAAVAETNAGLPGDMHMPNGITFLIGTWSLMFAAGWSLVIIRCMGSTTKVLIPGGTAKLHFNVAPLQT